MPPSKEGPGPQRRHVPRQGIQSATPWFTGQHSIHWDIPARAKGLLFKKIENNKCWWGCGEIGTLCVVGGNVKWYSHCGKQYGSSLKIKHISRYINKRIESRDSTRYLYTYVHSNSIHNSEKMKTIQIFFNRWMKKQNFIYIYIYIWDLEKIMLSEKSQTQKDK